MTRHSRESRRRVRTRLLIGASIMAAITVAAWSARHAIVTQWIVVAGVFVVMWALYEIFRSLQIQIEATEAKQEQAYGELLCAHVLLAGIRPRRPLQAMRGWAASPELLEFLAQEVSVTRPHLIVETGSGVSTIVIGYLLEQMGAGRVVSLEHDAAYADRMRAHVDAHGLCDFVRILDAPLVDREFDDQTWTWYETRGLELPGAIDLLFVDGPPSVIARLARYPALPVFQEALSEKATVVLDDGRRADETEIARRWGWRLGEGYATEFIETKEGAYCFRPVKRKASDEVSSARSGSSSTAATKETT